MRCYPPFCTNLYGFEYTEEFTVEKLMRDAKIMQFYQGASQIQGLATAREILEHH
ncbi:MAG: acyl-CoA dehydrogenase family protein [Thermodesulfobacteriota bacterium]